MEDEIVYAEIDEDGVRNLSSEWIKGMMEERNAVYAMITHALDHKMCDDLDGRTALAMLHAAIGYRTEFTD